MNIRLSRRDLTLVKPRFPFRTRKSVPNSLSFKLSG